MTREYRPHHKKTHRRRNNKTFRKVYSVNITKMKKN